ncbi:MAG: fused MFS/spermidine synthase [Candidatus Kerfeldbacteria bacterium]
MKKYLLEIIVFISGAVVMIFEITGSRILSPYVGTSTFVWTSLIGVILASLSIGYWLGGKLADKKSDYKTLALIIFFAGLLIGLITLIKDNVLVSIQHIIIDIRWASVISALTLFTIPSILLGMVSPYALKLKLDNIDSAGKTAGNLYAISTIGSIVGTFSAGFFLIPLFGNAKILIFLSIILVVVSLLCYSKKLLSTRIATIILILIISLINIPSPLNAIEEFIDLDTSYSRVWIYNDIDKKTNEPIKVLQISSDGHSAIFLNNDELVYEYTKYYHLAKHFFPEFYSTLMLGGAAYSYPKDFLDKYDKATIDVVEIDPKLTELAREYFGLVDNDRLTIIHEDGRTFINISNKKYDVIFGDAFTSFYSIPYQLTTIEAVNNIYNLLSDNGLAIINIASAIEGDGGKFLRAEIATYQEVFPQVYIIPVFSPSDGKKFQNIIMIALKSNIIPSFESPDKELNKYLSNLWTKDIPNDVPILTDDHAPVDYYLNIALSEIYKQ